MAGEMTHVRKPSVAGWLSTCGCGIGQIYCGRVGRGLVMFCLSLMLWPAMAILVYTGSVTVVFVGLGVLIPALIAFNIWSARDAKAIARSMAAIDYEPQEYNRPVVYGAMIAVWFPYAIGLALFLRSNVVEAFYLPTSSMAPSFLPGDRVLANKLGIESESFTRGEVVVFRNPQNRKQQFIKRIVGLPGETVEIKAGQLLINDQQLERKPLSVEEQLPEKMINGEQGFFETNGDRRYTILVDQSRTKSDLPKQTVPMGSYFVMGDHRDLSLDSREFGAISQGNITGRVIFNYRPADSWKRFGPVR